MEFAIEFKHLIIHVDRNIEDNRMWVRIINSTKVNRRLQKKKIEREKIICKNAH